MTRDIIRAVFIAQGGSVQRTNAVLKQQRTRESVNKMLAVVGVPPSRPSRVQTTGGEKR